MLKIIVKIYIEFLYLKSMCKNNYGMIYLRIILFENYLFIFNYNLIFKKKEIKLY